MSFKAKLFIDSKEYNLLSVNFGLSQETDATGRPSAITRGGKIFMTVEGTGGTELFELMANNFERKDGTITFYKRDTDASEADLNFTEAYCVKYHRNFDSTGNNPLTETIVVSAKEIAMGSGGHINEWV